MYRPEPESEKAQRQANLLLVFVLGVLIGASVMAIIVSNRCEASDQRSRVVDVPIVVAREVDVTREVKVTREVTKEVDSPRVVTRVVEVINGTTYCDTATIYAHSVTRR